MSFNRDLGQILMVSAALFLSGCGIHLGEKAPEQSAIAYNGAGYACVGEIPEHIEKYLSDELSEGEISDFMRCLQKSFITFAQLTRGRDESTYAPDEIRRFLESYFIKDRKISDQLLYEFMVIKQALVGGDVVRIARPELQDAVEFLDDIRLEAIRLKPFLKYLNPNLVVKQDPHDIGKHLNDANAALKQSIQTFANHLGKSKKDYALSDMSSFVSEFRIFVGWEEHFTHSHPVENWIALLKVFKEITVSSVEPDLIHEADWTPLLQAMSGWYLSFLQYEVGVKGQPFQKGVGLQNTMFLANQFFAMTTDAVKLQPNQTVTFDQIGRLVAALHEIGWLPEKIRPTSIDHAVSALVTRVAGDTDTNPADRRADGIDLMTIANMEGEFYRWAYVQLNLDNQFNGKSPMKVELTVPNLQSRPGLSPSVRAKINSLAGSEWDEFIKVKALIHPLFPDGKDRVELVPDAVAGQYSLTQGFYNLTMMNMLRSMVALVFRGYSQSSSGRELWASGIGSSELQEFYVDVRDLGIDLGWIDQRNTNAGNRSFLEGKLFTSSSTGLDYDPATGSTGQLGFVEAMNYFAFLYSGGEMATDVFTELKLVCPIGPLDLNGEPKVSRACVLANMPLLIQRYMGNMPGLVGFLQKSTPEVRKAYGQVLLQTAYSSTSDSNWVEQNEISTMAVIAHYAESVMTRFDRDQNGLLTNDEVELAVPIFSGLIKKIAKENFNKALSDREARGAFLFILSYKSIPSSLTDLAYIWKNEVWTPTLSLDRSQLIQVFEAIATELVEIGKDTSPTDLTPGPMVQSGGSATSVLLQDEIPAAIALAK